MHQILLTLLAFFARLILRVHHPMIIGITGTVGKTTVTAHVYGFLREALPGKTIGYSPDHYNGEYGLPLTIIGARTGGKNPLKWIGVFLQALMRLVRPYPEYLVLEYGIDHPGEMEFLLDIAPPDIAIITEIAPNHLEQFGSLENYRKEKLKLAHATPRVIAHDSLRDSIHDEAIYYGLGAMSDITAAHIEISPAGTSGTVYFGHDTYQLHVQAIGAFHIINLLPLYGLSDFMNIDPTPITAYAETSRSEPGRAHIFDGVGGSRIIDGSYNGGYLSIHSGIESLKTLIHSHHLILVLGDMRELGNETEILHKKLAEDIVELFPNYRDHIQIFLVGPLMRKYVFPLVSQNFHTESFLSSRDAGKAIKKTLLKSKDTEHLVYVKGSQNTIFLEETVDILLLNREDQKKLCRQTENWKKKKDAFFGELGA